MPIETMSQIRQNFASAFIDEVDEKFRHEGYHDGDLTGERGRLNHGTPHYTGETELSVVQHRGIHDSPHHNGSRTEDRRGDRNDRGWSDHHQ